MDDKKTIKDFKNRNRLTRTKAIFSVSKEMLYLFKEIENTIPLTYIAYTDGQSGAYNLEGILGFSSEIVNRIEEQLKLTFVADSEKTGNVCLANSPEVRDEYKETFADKDLLGYLYAVLHSPEYGMQNQRFSENDWLRIPYPKDRYTFWKLVGFGAHLRQLHTSKSPDVEKYGKESETILKKIAEIEGSR